MKLDIEMKRGPVANKQKKILIIDDDAEVTLLMKEILKSANYSTIVAHNGLEAVQKSNQENFDLILLDIRMPFFSGIWFCDAFKQKPETKDIPVIVVSGLPPEENMEKAYHVGAAAYLTKPFRPDDLLQIVSKVLS